MLELAVDLYEHCYWEDGDVRYTSVFLQTLIINPHENDQERKGLSYFQRLKALKCLQCQTFFLTIPNLPNFVIVKKFPKNKYLVTI